MAVIQISQIQVRSGLQEDLPQLATGEFGWSVDTQRLFIGKGSLAEGAPTIGVTEILTEYSIGLINVGIVALEANVANLAANVTLIQSQLANITGVYTETITLPDNTSTLANTTLTISSVTPSGRPYATSRIIDYNITRGADSRIGSMHVTQWNGNVIVFDEDYSETNNLGVTLYWTANITGNAIIGNLATLGYTTTGVGTSANLTYYLKNFY
jgi:hypothetical protein